MQIVLSKKEYIAKFEAKEIELYSLDVCTYEGKYYNVICGSTDTEVVLEPTTMLTKEEDVK